MKCGKCQKVIRSKIDRRNCEKYYPGFCSYHCQELARLDAAVRYLDEIRASSPQSPTQEGEK